MSTTASWPSGGQQSPYREQLIHVTANESRQGVSYTIRDEGPGFDPASLPDPTDPANLERVSGRGLLLILSFMDEVLHYPFGQRDHDEQARREIV